MPIQIGLINNMPDAVLEETESQFLDLLRAASGGIPLSITLFSLPDISRCERAQKRIASVYRSLDCLWDGKFDAVIVTGTEPRHADLRQEPYWRSLVDVLSWAEENTTSTILSCLAAHAGVLSSDGIAREPLPDKRFGLFSFQRKSDHCLTRGTGDVLETPHSRWNEAPRLALASSGYTILAESPTAGVDLFVKQKRKSLFVHFQGHPEYRNDTLFKEYRRDIKRFLKGARDTYPSRPRGYFDPATGEMLEAFRIHAMSHRCEEVMSEFPERVDRRLENRWHSTAREIYGNWLQYLATRSATSKRSSGISQPAVGRRREVEVPL